MLENPSGKQFLVIGGVLVVLGAVMAIAMVLKIMPTTFFLAFLAFAASTGGMLLGVAGAALLNVEYKNRDK